MSLRVMGRLRVTQELVYTMITKDQSLVKEDMKLVSMDVVDMVLP
jgi:hypothetical protein